MSELGYGFIEHSKVECHKGLPCHGHDDQCQICLERSTQLVINERTNNEICRSCAEAYDIRFKEKQ